MSQQRMRGRHVDGILLLDKPKGVSSNAALQRVKHLFKARKAGHTGSLDPLASGMLPICFGEATKFSQFLLEADKEYRVTAKLGVKTTSGDAEGDVISVASSAHITKSQLNTVLNQFRGSIRQIPSMFSALKYQGKPLYKLARQGITVERPIREVQIHALNLVTYQNDEFILDVHCSKGTYIRTLVEDIGDALGCGAHVIDLRRLTAGVYLAKQMVTFERLDTVLKHDDMMVLDQFLLPLGSSVSNWPDVQLSAIAAYYLKKGQPVMVPHAPVNGWVRLFAEQGSFLGVGEILSDGKVAPRRLVKINTAKHEKIAV